MPDITFYLFLLWAVALLLAVWAFRIAQVFAKRGPRMATQTLCTQFPAVAVILPIKGVDEDTAGNIAMLLSQDYPHYRLIFAVESENDPVTGLLRRIARAHPAGKVEIVVAGLATQRGQKVHNQLAGVGRTTDQDEFLAFLDADAKPRHNWIHVLVSPLTYGPQVGAATGYRFYVPTTPHPANAVVSLLNAMVAALFGPYRRTFAWGGSMAIRRKDFFGYGLHDAWQHALSDDYVLSHCVRAIGRTRIQFMPQCLVASEANFTWPTLFEFALRQYRITRICEPLVWLVATAGSGLYLFSLAYSLLMIFWSLHAGQPNWWHFVLMGGSLYVLSAVRGYYLMLGGIRLLPDHAAPIWRMKWWYTVGFPAVQAFNLLALLKAALGRRITWRGVTYTMASRTMTHVHRPPTPAPAPENAELVGTGKTA